MACLPGSTTNFRGTGRNSKFNIAPGFYCNKHYNKIRGITTSFSRRFTVFFCHASCVYVKLYMALGVFVSISNIRCNPWLYCCTYQLSLKKYRLQAQILMHFFYKPPQRMNFADLRGSLKPIKFHWHFCRISHDIYNYRDWYCDLKVNNYNCFIYI